MHRKNNTKQHVRIMLQLLEFEGPVFLEETLTITKDLF